MISLEQRCLNYKTCFPKYPEPFVGIDNRIQGIWILGNDYRSKTGYYGSYPPNYLQRVYSLFPEIINDTKKNILHLFSGSVDKTSVKCKEVTFDKRKLIELTNKIVIPDVTGNAESLSEYFKLDEFDLILADPPYSNEDANRYGTPMINRNKVIKGVYQILKPNGFVCWLDQVLPMYKKIEFNIKGVIGIVRSTNHRFRVLVIFQKML